MKINKLTIGWMHKCDYCGKEFEGRSERKFCCHSCKSSWTDEHRHLSNALNPNWKGGTKILYKVDHPDRIKANTKLQTELDAGRVTRPDKCSVCGLESDSIIGHHDDYSRPLEVKWLCSSCHMRLHFKTRRLEKAQTCQ